MGEAAGMPVARMGKFGHFCGLDDACALSMFMVHRRTPGCEGQAPSWLSGLLSPPGDNVRGQKSTASGSLLLGQPLVRLQTPFKMSFPHPSPPDGWLAVDCPRLAGPEAWGQKVNGAVTDPALWMGGGGPPGAQASPVYCSSQNRNWAPKKS